MSKDIEKREKQEVRATSPEQMVEAANAYSPDVDIYDNKDSLIVVMDLPGVARGDVAIEVDENNILSIRAKTSFQEPQGIIYREFNTGNYFRAFTIGDEFNKDAIDAQLENGVLQISIPRREEVKPRRIQINA